MVLSRDRHGLGSSLRHVESKRMKLGSSCGHSPVRGLGLWEGPQPLGAIPSRKNACVHTPKCVHTYTHAKIQESRISVCVALRGINVGSVKRFGREPEAEQSWGVGWSSEESLVRDIDAES